jgi:catechol 2,3-dioxygenase-like lactoylglutathione lyase family enzyme
MTGAIVGLDHVQVAAPDGCENEARRFYGELLGLEELEKPPLLAARGGVWFRVGAQQLHRRVAGGFVPRRRPIRHSGFVGRRWSSSPRGSRSRERDQVGRPEEIPASCASSSTILGQPVELVA